MKLLAARIAALGLLVTAVVLSSASAATATAIVQPGGVETVVANAPMTVVATGFRPASPVFVEQCDGLPPTTQNWSPTIDCDNGASPPPAISDSQGQASFPAAEPDRAFRPFQGESPSGLFNCVAPGAAKPANTLATFTNCQVRVSSNNASATDDQVFRPIVLSGRSVPLPEPTTSTTEPASKPTRAAGPPNRSAGVPARPAAKSSHAVGATTTTIERLGSVAVGVASVSPAASRSSRRGAGLLAVSNAGVGAGYLVVLAGLLTAVYSGIAPRRRRVKPGEPSVTGSGTTGER